MEARAAIGLGATLPILPEAGKRDIGFLLPLFAFAGLEKVVMRQAQVLRARGWRTHLVVAGALRMDWGPEIAECFDSVTLFQGLGEDRNSTPAISAAPSPAWGPIRRRRMRWACWRSATR